MSEITNRKLILEIIRDSLEELNPHNAVTSVLEFDPDSGRLTVSGENIPLKDNQGVWVLGGGKAAHAMGSGVEQVLGERITDGILICPNGSGKKTGRIQLMKASHPLPDNTSLSATLELVDLADKIPAGDVVICLISGGTSALMCLPAGNLEPEDLSETYRHLLRSGADIHEMNSVRTAISEIKGGGLLSRLAHTTVIDLIISDVPGDDFKTIGSGPTTPSEINYLKAHQILRDYGLWEKIPGSVRKFLTDRIEEPPQRDLSLPEHHYQFLISSAEMLAGIVAKQCRANGYETEVAEKAYSLPIADLTTMIREKLSGLESETDGTTGSRATRQKQAGYESPEDVLDAPEQDSSPGQTGGNENRKEAVILYGESSVTVSGNGKGGRNQELALRLARHITAGGEITFASFGTDGVDGPTDAAGAVVDKETLSDARDKGIDPEIYLSNNDSYNFFREVGGLIITGPTGNNLMDLQIILKDG